MVCNTIYSGSNPLDTSKNYFQRWFCIFAKNVFLRKLIKLILLFFFSSTCFCQCDYTLHNIENINCHDSASGEILVSILDNNSTFWWTGDNSFYSGNDQLSNLVAGSYVLHIMQNQVTGDTTSNIICYSIDTIKVEQSLPIQANFAIQNLCSPSDSADVVSEIIGGTPPYKTLWSNGDTTKNVQNLYQNNTYRLTITDTNLCTSNQFLYIPLKKPIRSYMSSDGAICKDDNSGGASVFISNANYPYNYNRSNGIIEKDNISSSSSISNVAPGWYSVTITDSYGCFIKDSIEVKSNPKKCLKFFKVFSPNDDLYNPFWKIENIEMYPNALIEVYSRSGEQVFRRRNYQNSIDLAFTGKDKNGKPLPSSTYYYVINLSKEDQVLKGAITIIR